MVCCGWKLLNIGWDKTMRDRLSGSNEQQFESIERSAVPTNRKSKHHEIVEKILREVDGLKAKRALRIPRRRTRGGQDRAYTRGPKPGLSARARSIWPPVSTTTTSTSGGRISTPERLSSR